MIEPASIEPQDAADEAAERIRTAAEVAASTFELVRAFGALADGSLSGWKRASRALADLGDLAARASAVPAGRIPSGADLELRRPEGAR